MQLCRENMVDKLVADSIVGSWGDKVMAVAAAAVGQEDEGMAMGASSNMLCCMPRLPLDSVVGERLGSALRSYKPWHFCCQKPQVLLWSSVVFQEY